MTTTPHGQVPEALTHERDRAIMEGERNASLDAYSRVVLLTSAESRLYEAAFTNGWGRRAAQVAELTAAPGVQANTRALESVALLADILNRRPAMNAGLVDAYAHWTAEVYDLMGAMAAEPANDAATAQPADGAAHVQKPIGNEHVAGDVSKHGADMYYAPEGWYEWNQCEDNHWRVTETPRAWPPLPPTSAEGVEHE